MIELTMGEQRDQEKSHQGEKLGHIDIKLIFHLRMRERA